MKIKYSPIKSNRTTEIEVIENGVMIDGEAHEFPEEIVEFPDVAEKSGGAIIEAKRMDGELYLTILRRYTGGRPVWDTAGYHDVTTQETTEIQDYLESQGVESDIAAEAAKEVTEV